MTDHDGTRYVHYAPFGNPSFGGELQLRDCGICNRQTTVLGEWYHCIDHGTQGKIRTKAEEAHDLATCDPRWRVTPPIPNPENAQVLPLAAKGEANE